MYTLCIFWGLTSLILSLNVTAQTGITCLDINFHTPSPRLYNWDFAPCLPIHANERKRGTTRWKFIQKCCLPNGEYLLMCENTQTDGWMDSVVKIGQHRFCDDYTSYNSIVKLNIQGTYSFLKSKFLFFVYFITAIII